jgi:hypothetical protein
MEWIRIDTELPNEGQRVLFYSPEADDIVVGCRHGLDWYDEGNGDARGDQINGVSHWMPMPPKPKTVEEHTYHGC